MNIESITAFAVDELRNEEPVTDEPLNEDWTTRFFKIAEDISNEEMQVLWGKILAGEIKQPKSYSLRTLELLRNISKEEAEIFRKVANFAIKRDNVNCLFNDIDILEKKFDIVYSDRALLTEIGLLQPGTFVKYRIFQNTKDTETAFIAGRLVFVIKVKADTPTVEIPVDVFSAAGNELLKLLKPNPPFDYLSDIANSVKSDNVEVKYADIITVEDMNISYMPPLKDF